MSLITSNRVDIEGISIKGLHNKAISILKEMCKKPIKNEKFFIYYLAREEDNFVLKIMGLYLPHQIQKNPELTEENIQIMKEYLYNRFIDTGTPLKDLNVMSAPIKEKDYIL